MELPKEMMIEILSYVSAYDMMVFSQTCKENYNFLKVQNVMENKEFAINKNVMNFEFLGKIPWKIYRLDLNLNDHFTLHDVNYINKIPHLKMKHFFYFRDGKIDFSHVKTLDATRCGKYTEQMLKNFSAIETLFIDGYGPNRPIYQKSEEIVIPYLKEKLPGVKNLWVRFIGETHCVKV